MSHMSPGDSAKSARPTPCHDGGTARAEFPPTLQSTATAEIGSFVASV